MKPKKRLHRGLENMDWGQYFTIDYAKYWKVNKSSHTSPPIRKCGLNWWLRLKHQTENFLFFNPLFLPGTSIYATKHMIHKEEVISDHFLMLRFLTKNTELYVVTWMTKQVTLSNLNTGLGGWGSQDPVLTMNFFRDFSYCLYCGGRLPPCWETPGPDFWFDLSGGNFEGSKVPWKRSWWYDTWK